MTLNPMPETEIRTVLESSETPDFVVLTSGKLVYAESLSSISEIEENLRDDLSVVDIFDVSRSRLDEHEYLVVGYHGIRYGYHVAIPYSDVADLISASFSQTQTRSNSPPSDPYKSPVARILYGRSLEIAREAEYPIHTSNVAARLASSSNFSWGEVNFSGDTPLYCDWDYLERRSGGVTSLGGGALGISFSAGWDESLWSEFKGVVEASRVELHEIGDHEDTVTSGFIDFVTHGGEHVSREMDGTEWIAGVISDRPVEDVSELEDASWSVGFFRRDAAMFPLDAWEYVTDPVVVFGEVIDSPIETGFGSVDYFLKARACAYLDEQV